MMIRRYLVHFGAGAISVIGCGGVAYASTSSSKSNPQPFTGYWKLPSGDVFFMKQWGESLTSRWSKGEQEGSVRGDSAKVGDAEYKITEDCDTVMVVKDGESVEAQRHNPVLVVICGPSGVGKGTLLKKLFDEYPQQFGFSVSHTTRNPRPGEEDGKDYHFIAKDAIKSMIDNNRFIEYAEVHGNYYGTSIAAVETVQKEGRICVLDIDVQGAQKVAKAGLPFVGIFIKPPSKEELERRLRGRGTETEEKIQKRLKNALGEVEFCDQHNFFWYELVNDNLDVCYTELVRAIAQSTKAKHLPAVPSSENATPLCGVTPA